MTEFPQGRCRVTCPAADREESLKSLMMLEIQIKSVEENQSVEGSKVVKASVGEGGSHKGSLTLLWGGSLTTPHRGWISVKHELALGHSSATAWSCLEKVSHCLNKDVKC